MNEFLYKKNELCVESVLISDIAKEVSTPFYCYSQSNIERKYLDFKNALGTIDGLICFAIKSNSNLSVLRTLQDLGAGADVVSGGELELALKAGIPAHKIVFSGVGKTKTELTLAVTKKIKQINIESRSEALLLDTITQELGQKITVALRVNPDIDAKTHAKISTGKKENKFGISWNEARKLYQELKQMPFVEPMGVDFHIGSQLTSLEPFRDAFVKIKSIVQTLRQDGIDLRVVDVGGGIGVCYEKSDTPPTMPQYMKLLNEILGDLNCSFIFEPGRSLVAQGGVLVTKVVHIKQTDYKLFAVVDAGMNDLVRVAMYDAYHGVLPVEKKAGLHTKKYDIVGPICESSDVFTVERPMQELKAGDLIVLETAGAYGSSMSSNYNTRSLPAEVLVKEDRFAVVRRPQSIEEMVALQSLALWQK